MNPKVEVEHSRGDSESAGNKSLPVRRKPTEKNSFPGRISITRWNLKKRSRWRKCRSMSEIVLGLDEVNRHVQKSDRGDTIAHH